MMKIPRIKENYFVLRLMLGLVLLLATNSLLADEWKIYASYHNVTKAVKTDSRIFVLANGDLFSYDSEDNMVELYDKTNA